MTPPRRNARRRPNALASSIAALLLGTAFGPAQTFTSGTGGSFTDTLVWNFGAGPLPASDPALVLGLQSFGGAVVGSNDLNLTLRELDLIGNGTFTLNAQNGGGLAFTGGAGLIDFGSSATMTLGTGIVFGTGLTSLTLDGRGPGALTLAGVIASNTSAGAPVIIATDALNPSSGVVTLSGNNTFSGGVVLNSGTLNLASNRALGDAANVLTVNGGSVRTTSSATIENDFALASDLNLDGTFVLTLGGTLSGAGGLTQSGNGASGVVRLTGVNTYTGATTVRGLDHGIAPTDQGGAIHIAGAAGSILTTSGIDVSAGGTLRLVYSEGHSAANARVAGGTAINLGGGFLEVVGNDGVLTHNFGNVTASGLTTILAASNGGNAPSQPGAATEVTIANLTRGTGGTVTFSGENLGAVAVAPNLAAAQGNVILTQIDGAAPSAALVGGGGAANTTNISILPWALGDFSNLTGNSGAGTGFVTYGPNGVRLLDPTTEYNSTNVLDGLPDGFQNIRVSNSVVDPTGPVTLNSLFIDSAGLSIGGTEVITIGSGALAANADTSISAPLTFGVGGTGEAIVSMVAPLGNPGALTMNLSGTITAGSLVKSGHGTVLLGGAGNSITGGVTINAGQLSVDAITALGGASSLTFRSPSQSAAGAMLNYTGGAADVLNVPVVTDSGMAGFGVDSASLDVSGAISGAGGIRKSGAGTLVLSGVNTYTGGTYLGAGSLEFDTDARLGAAGGFLHTSGGTISLTGPWTSNRTITIDSGVPLTLSKGTNAVTFTGALEGTGPVRVLGSGTVTISAPESGYAGAITLGSVASEGGTLALTGGGSINGASIVFGEAGAPAGTYALDLSGATAPSGTPWRAFNALTTTGAFGQAHSVQLGSSALAPVDVRVSSGSFGGTAGVIQGFGRLVKVGSATLTLNGSLANTFTGGVEVWNGTLSYGADGQLGNAANGITLRGGTLNSTANGTTARAISLAATPLPMLRGTGAVQTIPNALSAASGTARTFSGVLSGPGGLNKSGLGTVTLTGTNTYAGDTQVSAGILAFNSDAQLGSMSSRVRLSPGGTLRLAALTGTVPLNRPVFVLGSGTINVATTAPTLNLNGQLLAAPGSELQLTGPGKFGIGADNRSFFGTLRISSNGAANSIGLAGHLRRANLQVSGVDTSFTMANLVRDLGGITTIDVGSNVQLGSGGQLTTGWNNGNMSWAGEINQSGITPSALFKTGTGTISLTNTSTKATNLGGGIHLLSGTGNTTLSEGGALGLQTAFTVGAWGNSANRGPVLVLSNTSLNSNLRLADTQAFHSNSGEIQLTSNGLVATNEVTGSLRGAGMTTVTMSGGTLNFSNVATGLTRLNGGTFLFRGNNASFGAGVASVSNANLLFGNLPGSALIGGGGAANSTTISILPFAVGGTTASSLGTNFVTYGGNGIRVLNTGSEVVTNTNSASLTGAANDNVRFNNSALTNTVLTGGTDRTINALNLSGTANTTQLTSAGTERLIVSSGLILNTVSNVYTTDFFAPTGITLGIQVAELQTGAGNARELNVFTTSGDLALGSRVTTTGGLTKSGAGRLFLTNAANTYDGTTTINAGDLVIDNLAALGAGPTVAIGGGFLHYRGTDATFTKSIFASGGAGAGLGASAGIHVVGGTTLVVGSGTVTGNGGILKDGAGVLRLQGTNTNTGATLIAAGTLAIDSPGALGGDGRVVFTNSSISTGGGQTLRFDAPMTMTQDFVVNSSQNSIGFGFDTNGNSVTLTGTMLDARGTGIRGLYKFGAGELNLTATQMYTGPTQIFGGTLRLSGPNGSVMNSTGTGGFSNQGSIVIGPGAALVLDNVATNNNNRLPDVWDTPFGTGNAASGGIAVNGGELRLIGNTAGTSERINQIEIASGTVTLSGGGTTLTSGQVIRSSTSGSSAVFIRGTNLGALPGPTSTNWFVTDLGSGGVELHGAGGAEGTPFINILRGGMGDTSATGTGTDLLTYAADTGFRPLAPSEYTSAIPANNFDLNRAPNIALTGAATVNQTTAITALKLGAGSSLGGSGTALLAQSTVLATGNASIDVPSLSTNLTNAGPSTIFLTAGAGTTLTVNSVLPGTAMGKYGLGTVLLNARRIGSGRVSLNQGTLTLGGSGALSPRTQLAIDPGASFDLGGSDRAIGSLNQAGPTIGNFQLGQTSAGTVNLGANRLTLYDATNASFSGDITGSGGVTKAFNSTGTTTFTQPQSYTGSTVIAAGTLQLAGRGRLASSAIEIRGGTLALNDLDDLATGGYVANRIGTTPIVLAGGTITFTESANTPGNHQLGAITLAGAGAVQIVQGTRTPSTLTIENLSRGETRGTLSLTTSILGFNANFGFTQSLVGGARIFLTQIEGGAPSAALIGGGGPIGSATSSILPWAVARDVSGGASLLSYGPDGVIGFSGVESNQLDAPSTDTVNAFITVPQTLTAPRTVNSLSAHATGSVSGAYDLTLTSGLLLHTGGLNVIGTNTNTLRTGVGNTRELIINNTSPVSISYNITTTGGVTKTGGGALYLEGTNTFTGGLVVNDGSVIFTDEAQLGATGGAIRFGGAKTSTTSIQFQGVDTSTLDFTRPVQTASYGGFTGQSNHRWKVGGIISGVGGFRYSGADAVFELNAAHTYSGPTTWAGGHLYISSDAAFGGGGALSLESGQSSAIVLRAPWSTGRLIDASTGGTLQTNGFDATWSGQFIGSAPLAKYGTGSLTLTEAMPYSGALTVQAGEARLRDRGSLAANGSTLRVNPGAALTLDDTGVHFSDRLHDNAGSLLLSGGALNVLGSSSATTEEVLNNLVLESGAATITLAPGSGQSVIVRIAGSVSDAGQSANLWRGTNLGVNAPGTANSANILFTPTNTNQFPVTGGGAPAGHPSVSVLRGAFGDTSATGSGTQLVTYDAVRGVRLLDPATEYTTTLVNGSVVTDNVRADGTVVPLANATTINALWLKDGGGVTGVGDLTLRSGNLLVTGSGNSVAKPIVTGINALAIGGPGNVTFTSPLPSANSGGLIKTGAGTLTLSVANSYTGDTILKDGVLAVGNASAFNATALNVQGGELRNDFGSPLTIGNDVILNGKLKVGGAQDFTFSGTVTLNNATREIETTNSGMTTISGVIQNSQSLINYGLTKTGPGTLELANSANLYDGPTTIRAGVLSVGTLADGSRGSILNPSGIGQSWSDADQLVFDGGTLRYTGPLTSTDRLFTLTPNGGTIDARGTGNLTFSNIGAIAAPAGGARTLTLTGNNTTINTMAVRLTDGPSLTDATSLVVSGTHWRLTNANTFTGATTVNAGTLEAAADGSLGGTGNVTVNTGGTLLLSGSGNRISNSAAINLAGGKLETGGTSEGAATSVGLGTLTLSAASVIDFTGAAATLTFAGATYGGGTLSIMNWSGSALTAGTDGVNDRLVFAGDNAARLAFLGNFSQSSISFAGFGFGYSAIQFDPGYFEIVPVPEPSAAFGTVALLGLAAFRERRRERRARAASRSERS